MSPRVGARPDLSVGQAFITCPASRLPARGRDQASAPAAPRRADFNPLALCEGTTRHALELRDRPCISIHPPAQGTTPEQTRQNGENQAFPPCSHAREGPGVLQRPSILAAFQSTSPREVRRQPRAPWPRRGSHSTSSACTGCDHCPPNRPLFINLFRFTHPRGVRPDAVSPPEGRRPHLDPRSAAPHPPGPSPPSAPRRAKRARGRLPRALLKRSVPLISPSWRLRKPDRPLSSRCPRPFQSGRT